MAAALQCEICGGMLIGRPGGVFECDSCGMKYDTAWAKAKIQEIRGTVKVEGTVEVTGKVQIDGPVKVEGGGPTAESLVKRGIQALEDKKWKKAEEYVNKALDIDPENGEAFRGLYFQSHRWFSVERALNDIWSIDRLEDRAGFFLKTKKYAKGETRQIIERIEAAWAQAQKENRRLPDELLEAGFSIHNGVLSSQDNGDWDKYLCIKDVTIPEGVTDIDGHAFSGWTGFECVTIPAGVTCIGYNAFENCESLTSITIPKSVKEICAEAFSGCTGLKSVTIPEGIKYIEMRSFSGCTGLTSVTIPKSVKAIDVGAFEGCTALTSITIPDGVECIQTGAFQDCTNLTSVTIPPSVTEITNNWTFYGCPSLVIYANEDSYAARYARENNIPLRYL